MTDQQLWSAAIERVRIDYSALPQALKQRLSQLSGEIAALKGEHQQAVALPAADKLCADCKGLCCKFGRHHFTVVDLIVYLSLTTDLFTPDFDHPVCPYHSGCGCLMEPSFRPFNCIIFICDEVECQLSTEVRTGLAVIETRLRVLYDLFDKLLGNRFANGLLITFSRSLDTGQPLFKI